MFKVFRDVKLPDVFTFLNLTFGFSGIYCIFSNPVFSYHFLFASVIMDGADGMVASKFGKGILGKDLDSLADAVSFGVLPALMIANLGDSVAYLAIAMLYLLTGILRLARFNVLSVTNFIGYPITASALMIASMLYLGFDSSIVVATALILSMFMICDVEYVKVRNKPVLLVVGLVIIASFFIQQMAYLTLIAAFLYLLSPLRKVIKWMK
jgi:CDP-diacylglycerol--serine O-phosphatidyltransferase